MTVISLFTCHECGRRWWSDVEEDYEHHECAKHDHPMLERWDVETREREVETARQGDDG
jgi:hypothetical protein